MSKKLTIAEVTTLNTARDLIIQAHRHVSSVGEAILARSIESVGKLTRIKAGHVQPLLGLMDGFISLTVQYGKVAGEARKAYQEDAKSRESEDESDFEVDCGQDSSEEKPPANKVPDFDHRGYRCHLDQARASLANAYILLNTDAMPTSPTTPVPSVEGAMGRSTGTDSTRTRH